MRALRQHTSLSADPLVAALVETSHFLLKMRERGEEGDGKVGGEGAEEERYERRALSRRALLKLRGGLN